MTHFTAFREEKTKERKQYVFKQFFPHLRGNIHWIKLVKDSKNVNINYYLLNIYYYYYYLILILFNII